MDSYHTGAPSAAVAHTPPVKTNMRGKIFKVCGSCGTMAKSNRSFSCHTCKAPFPPSTKKRASKKRASKKRASKKRKAGVMAGAAASGGGLGAAASKRVKSVYFLDELMADWSSTDDSANDLAPDASTTNAEPNELCNPPLPWTMDDDELFAEFYRDESPPVLV